MEAGYPSEDSTETLAFHRSEQVVFDQEAVPDELGGGSANHQEARERE
jgi:hypothetical protein